MSNRESAAGGLLAVVRLGQDLVANVLRRYRGVLLVLLAAAALRFALLGWAALHHRSPLGVPDAERYHLLALNLLRSQRFSLPGHDTQPETLRTPGFPVFLAGVYALVGPSPYRTAVVLVIVSCGLCAALYVLADRAFGPRAALIAGLAIALSPGAVLNSITILSDTLHAILLAGALLILHSVLRTASSSAALGCGLLLGLSALTRPVSLYTPLVVAPVVWWATRAVRPALCLLTGALVVAVPWMLRNQAVAGRFTFSNIAEHNLWYHNLSYARARAEGIPVEESRRLYADEVQASGVGDVARRDVKRYWRHLLVVQAVGTAMFWVAPDGYQWSHFLNAVPKATYGHDRMWDAGLLSALRRLFGSPGGIASAVQLAYNAAESILALTGLLLCIKRPDRRALAVFAASWCLYYAVVTSVVANGRYRLPAEIVMVVLAGTALDAGLRAVSSRKRQDKHAANRRPTHAPAGGSR